MECGIIPNLRGKTGTKGGNNSKIGGIIQKRAEFQMKFEESYISIYSLKAEGHLFGTQSINIYKELGYL
ncbi:hypothetical protein M3226_05020 [Neobacillus cucumis]|uniref:hypothetical protein n=1 Tax=Neobacillus cucumis TaxID=1740721 RepID=UPI00203F549B|nr:hypothetical protein [Neobacillus cucumis]MCM3725059.1 hypothetical protein [Neobacillus cucumis]